MFLPVSHIEKMYPANRIFFQEVIHNQVSVCIFMSQK